MVADLAVPEEATTSPISHKDSQGTQPSSLVTTLLQQLAVLPLVVDTTIQAIMAQLVSSSRPVRASTPDTAASTA